MALEKMDIYYNSVAETYDDRVRRATTDEDGYIVRMAAAFPMKENLNIIDLGAGTGLQLKPLLEKEATLRATCVDCSGKMLARLKKNLADYSDRVQVVSADFFDHDFGFENMAIVITVLAYFCVLLLFSHLTARNMASNETFYRANRRSPWYMVATVWWERLFRASLSSVCRAW